MRPRAGGRCLSARSTPPSKHRFEGQEKSSRVQTDPARVRHQTVPGGNGI